MRTSPTLFDTPRPPTREEQLRRVRALLAAHEAGILGGAVMPEDAVREQLSGDAETCLRLLTLPMALNYQRNSYRLWESVAECYTDRATAWVFDVQEVVKRPEAELAHALLLHRVALQPNRHPRIWHRICSSLCEEFEGRVTRLLRHAERSVDQLRDTVQQPPRRFPYLAGPKIVNYWMYVLEAYAGVRWIDREAITVAPDTHVMQASAHLGLSRRIGSEDPQDSLEVAEAWRELLEGTDIAPIDVHTPLWLWSRAGFPDVMGLVI